MTKASGNVNGFCTGFDEFCRMSVAEAMCVETERMQDIPNGVIENRQTEIIRTNKWEALRVFCRGFDLWCGAQLSRTVSIDDLIGIAKIELVLCLRHFPPPQGSEQNTVDQNRALARFCFWRRIIELSLLGSRCKLIADMQNAVLQVDIIPCEASRRGI